jgi:hypothetical protein
MRHSTMMATAAFATLIATSAFAANLPERRCYRLIDRKG